MHHRMHILVEGKWPTYVVAIQFWQDSGSATEQFQRKSHKISPLYVICVICRMKKLAYYKRVWTWTDNQTDRQTDRMTTVTSLCMCNDGKITQQYREWPGPPWAAHRHGAGPPSSGPQTDVSPSLHQECVELCLHVPPVCLSVVLLCCPAFVHVSTCISLWLSCVHVNCIYQHVWSSACVWMYL